MIRINIDLVRSQVSRQSIFAFDPDSAGSRDYQSLIDELVGNVVSFPKGKRSPRGSSYAAGRMTCCGACGVGSSDGTLSPQSAASQAAVR
jgi:hypothetical protein